MKKVSVISFAILLVMAGQASGIPDIYEDGCVDLLDFAVFTQAWMTQPSDDNWNAACDISEPNDDVINGRDLAVLADNWLRCEPPGITYQVDDCNMQAGQSSAVAVESGETRFSVSVEGNYIHFEDLITANCCADEIELQMTVDDNLITIHEIEHLTIPCDCICDFPVTATLGPFEEGTYLVEVIDIYGNSLGVVEVTIGQSQPSITYQIDNCNLGAGLMSAPSAESDELRFSVTVQGRYIHFEDMMVANCCPEELGLEMTVEDNLITIYETEYTPGGCWCICDYPVTATLGPFEPGIYTLEVYEDWGGFIGSTTVTIE